MAVYRRGAGKRPGPLPCAGEGGGRAALGPARVPAAVLPRSAPAPLAAARGRQRAAARRGAGRGVAPLTARPRVTGPGPRPRSPPARAAWGTAHLQGELRGLLETSGGPGGCSGAVAVQGTGPVAAQALAAGLALGRPCRCSAAAPRMGRQAAAVGEQGEENWGVEPTRLELKVPQRPSSYVSERCGEAGRVQLQVEGLHGAQRFLYLL